MEKSAVKGRVKMTGEERTPKQLRRETRAVEREWMWPVGGQDKWHPPEKDG